MVKILLVIINRLYYIRQKLPINIYFLITIDEYKVID